MTEHYDQREERYKIAKGDAPNDTVTVPVEMTPDVRAFLFALLGSDTWLEASAVWEHNPDQRKAAHAAVGQIT